jgi:DNA-directed RNA polymerase sigma subunit (sigma70/sigma32)
MITTNKTTATGTVASENIAKSLSYLDEREQEILIRLQGSDGRPGETLESISRNIGISELEAEEIKNQALVKIDREKSHNNETLAKALSYLDEDEQEILIRLQGLDGRPGETLESISRDIGISEIEAEEIKNRALAKIGE